VGISVGVTEHRAGESVAQTIERAELALQNAQAAGSNRVVLT
jgi:PleD family two-component response regulator